MKVSNVLKTACMAILLCIALAGCSGKKEPSKAELTVDTAKLAEAFARAGAAIRIAVLQMIAR